MAIRFILVVLQFVLKIFAIFKFTCIAVEHQYIACTSYIGFSLVFPEFTSLSSLCRAARAMTLSSVYLKSM